jgi:hypothetical protein
MVNHALAYAVAFLGLIIFLLPPQEPSLGVLRPFSEPAAPPPVYTPRQLKAMATAGALFCNLCVVLDGFQHVKGGTEIFLCLVLCLPTGLGDDANNGTATAGEGGENGTAIGEENPAAQADEPTVHNDDRWCTLFLFTHIMENASAALRGSRIMMKSMAVELTKFLCSPDMSWSRMLLGPNFRAHIMGKISMSFRYVMRNRVCVCVCVVHVYMCVQV